MVEEVMVVVVMVVVVVVVVVVGVVVVMMVEEVMVVVVMVVVVVLVVVVVVVVLGPNRDQRDGSLCFKHPAALVLTRCLPPPHPTTPKGASAKACDWMDGASDATHFLSRGRGQEEAPVEYGGEEGVKVLMIDALQARRSAGRGSAVHLAGSGATV
ncbi:unnamed protein product [Boreogadus saida]